MGKINVNVRSETGSHSRNGELDLLSALVRFENGEYWHLSSLNARGYTATELKAATPVPAPAEEQPDPAPQENKTPPKKAGRPKKNRE